MNEEVWTNSAGPAPLREFEMLRTRISVIPQAGGEAAHALPVDGAMHIHMCHMHTLYIVILGAPNHTIYDYIHIVQSVLRIVGLL